MYANKNVDIYESFKEYLGVVVDNTSIPFYLYKYTKDEFDEMVYLMYYKDIPDTKAVLIMENFYKIYRKYLNGR